MDIQNSMTPILKKITLACSLSLIIAIISIGTHEYYVEQCKAIEDNIMFYQMETKTQHQFVESNTYALVQSLSGHEYWEDEVYQSIGREPLVVTSSSKKGNILDITLVASSQSFLKWLNTIQDTLDFCTVQICSIDTQGNSISFRCKIAPRES